MSNDDIVEDCFLRDACALLGLAVESPLAVAVNAGCVALPALLNIKQVMLQVIGAFFQDLFVGCSLAKMLTLAKVFFK